MRRENLPPSAAPRMSESTFVTAVQWNYDDDKLIGGWNGDLNYSKKTHDFVENKPFWKLGQNRQIKDGSVG